MVSRDGAAIRKERIQGIAKYLQSHLYKRKELSFSKALASLQYEFGLTEEKTIEYLEILENLGQFTLDRDKDKITRSDSNE